VFIATAYAQQKEIVFTRTTTEKGLAANKLNAIIKDKQGYYWLSSANGLQRYDGHRMVNFRHNADDSTSLPDNFVDRMMEDNRQRLWINAGGIPCVYNPLRRNFKRIPVEGSEKEKLNIGSFFQDSKGSIWMIAGSDGLYVLDAVKNIFRSHTSVWPKLFSSAHSMAEDAATGRYWLTTDKGDLIMYDTKTKQYHGYENNPDSLQCFVNKDFSKSQGLVYLDRNRILWSHGWKERTGFVTFRYDIEKNDLRLVKTIGPQLWGFITDEAGTTWCYGTFLGRYDESRNEFVELPKKRNSLHGIDFNMLYNMYLDRENNFWVMSDLGLYSFNLQQQYFTSVNSPWSYFMQEHTDAASNGFLQTNDGHIIALGWNGDGLLFFDSAFNQVKPLYGYNPSDFINDGNFRMTWCGLQDSRGLIWVGAQHSRIIQINPVTKKVSSFIPPEFENHTLRSIAEDKEGNIWFGSQRNVVVKWTRNTTTFTQILNEENVKQPLGWVLTIIMGADNDLWIGGTTGGLLHFDIVSGRIMGQYLHDEKNPQSISSNAVHVIEPLNKDTIALATNKGIDLFSISKKTFYRITDNDGLPGGGIIALVADKKKNLWFTSSNGIAKIHLPEKRIHSYHVQNGITESDFQLHSFIRLRDGRIVFGNTRSLVYFNPAEINETAAPSDVVISGFHILNSNYPPDSLLANNNRIRLKYSQNYITIQFASLKNNIYSRPVYYYMLEGINKDWVATQNPEAVYAYLPAGTYTFKVKAISADGVASANITSFKIHIIPPFYQAWWFYTLIGIFIAAIIWFTYRQRINKLLAVEKLRTKVARDLHDDMGSTLSTINILSSMAKTKMTEDPMKTGEYINKISDNSQWMMEAMDDIVWAIRPDNDNMQKITARMREFATGILEAKDIELDFKVDEKASDIKLNMEARRDFFLIFKEAVNNVAKYSHCSKCSIHISMHQKRLLLTLTDNGVGFDITKADSGNGLSNMQKRAEALKGRTTVQSKPGEGTKVTVNVGVE